MNEAKVEIKDYGGIAKIKIDDIKLKNVNQYKIKRDTDIVELTFTINVSPENLFFNKN